MTGIKNQIVYIIEDDPAVRKLIESLLRSVDQPYFSFESGQEFLDACDPEISGCIVMDIRMPEIGGMALLRLVREKGVQIPIIIITGYADVQLVVRAFKAGVMDFIEKPFKTQDLLDCIHEALRLDAVNRRGEETRREYRNMMAALTQRERSVMALILDGSTNKRIASELAISRKTLDIHKARVFEKMQVENAAELAKRVLIARGVIPHDFSFLSD